ncbi:MAG: hypothetical protein WBA44_11090 [Mesorhizobium sp.]
MSLKKLALAACAGALVAGSAVAQPALPPVKQSAVITVGFLDRPEARQCDDQGILGRISSRFRHQVTHVPNLPQVSIVDIHRVHQHRNYVASEDHPIARRYCGATVELSDGRKREMWYLIEEGMGFASVGDNVEFCVSGFDRWNVYNGRCRVLR